MLDYSTLHAQKRESGLIANQRTRKLRMRSWYRSGRAVSCGRLFYPLLDRCDGLTLDAIVSVVREGMACITH